MADNKPTIQEIHDNFLNGNIRDGVKLIHEFGPDDFFAEYQVYLEDFYEINSNSWRHMTFAIRMFTHNLDCKMRE